MSFVQLLVAAASLFAAAGGAWGVDRVLDRYTQISESPASAEDGLRDEDEDPKLLY